MTLRYHDEQSRSRLARLPRVLRRTLLRYHYRLSPFFPNRYYAYKVAGGEIYLNVKESRMMLARALDLFQIETFNAFRAFVRPGDTVVDVGANKGDFTLLAADLVGVHGSVLSFEPNSTNLYWLHKSVERSNRSNAVIYDYALSDAEGTTNLHLGDTSGTHSLIACMGSRSTGTETVQTRTLDSVLNGKRADIIKIDVEGAEVATLKGSSNTLGSARAVLVDIHPALGVNPSEVCALLNESGFSLYELRTPFDTRAEVQSDLKEVLAVR